ncbi:MAG: hypothetical protein A3C30_04320 [Candidatus Levybacteria bacterium RIFCSPHIGHO2_02_FULL_40_18]|nr:MAG: hypothetical protein A2869_01650 [Candidatus Levybacteria bacterium RIFCSPHIGHO2_01_FULL_40_58]OGH26307.1 MAG: hypothetical protein A3C30_04320 [Candidatus Levybacteria bacterium RIFCSPHIGHO2_02_FULL_40_18]OGH31266.1 MAG: hypothetical protein A3E43_02575 [Candidatus Levybacteria bacterium RIFCSPHIGHO2_12_FULL_40_31]OGH40336.1 MAG: hypothetical protein A2894_05285 [Candidatus Levybacteria bacterium RIFCSPLOWO2_01_FULL_40_64]OGH49236.1 MAG: hypothetical protein A3I54_01155 [Candidatus Lev
MNIKSISISNSEKLGLISNFATMLEAGLSILEIVDSLLEDSKGNQKKLLEVLREDLMQGVHISASFEKFPKIFDKVTVNLIKAAEEGGTLDVTLLDLKENIRMETEFRDKIRAALTYPAFILLVFIGVLLMILTVVIPKISTVFLRLNVPLPLPTQILILLSDLILKQTIFLVLGGIILLIVFIFMYINQKHVFLNILFSFPLVGSLARQIDLTRFSRNLYILLNAGIPITTALELTQEIVLKKEVAQAIIRSRDMVLSGNKLSEGLKAAKNIFPSIMIKITEAGEKSGSLDKSMQDVSEYLDYQVSTTLRTLISLLEPIMLIVVGIIVGGMMLAIISPIYGLIGQVGPR